MIDRTMNTEYSSFFRGKKLIWIFVVRVYGFFVLFLSLSLSAYLERASRIAFKAEPFLNQVIWPSFIVCLRGRSKVSLPVLT